MRRGKGRGKLRDGDTSEMYGSLGIVHKSFKRNLNVANLPGLQGVTPASNVPAEYTFTNAKKEKENKKKLKAQKALGISAFAEAGLNSGRPGSAKSGFTAMTGGTAAFTQYTGGQTNHTGNEQQNMVYEQNVIKLMDKGAKLTDFLQYDTTLGREQNIVMGKVSSLGDTEGMEVKPGVKLTQFLP